MLPGKSNLLKFEGAVVKTFETGPMRPLSKVFFSTLFINSYLQGNFSEKGLIGGLYHKIKYHYSLYFPVIYKI